MHVISRYRIETYYRNRLLLLSAAFLFTFSIFADEPDKEPKKEKTKEQTMLLQYADLSKEIFKEGFFNRNISIDYDTNDKSVDKSVEEYLQICCRITENYEKQLRSLELKEPGDLQSVRKSFSADPLTFRHAVSQQIDKEYDFTKPVYRNIGIPGYISGGDPKSIENIEDRKQYEDALWKNNTNIWQHRIQRTLRDIEKRLTKSLSKYFMVYYSQNPRADDELIGLLDKYKYPEEEKAKIFKALNIPYKGFREWQTNDGLFKPTAKFIFYDAKVKEATLEREDGKRMSIEWSALRKEDQDYIRRQIELDQEKLKD